MSSRKFPFLTSEGSEVIPVADGDFMTEEMTEVDTLYQFGDCFLQFYNLDVNGELEAVTPTAGTIQFRSGAFRGQFLEPSASNTMTIEATNVMVGNANYTPPSFNSYVRQSKMTLSGIAGATHVKAFHWRYSD